MLITNWLYQSIGTNGGLIYDIMYIMIMMVLNTNGLNFFNPWWARRLYKQYKLRAKAEEHPEAHSITMAEAKMYFHFILILIKFSYLIL